MTGGGHARLAGAVDACAARVAERRPGMVVRLEVPAIGFGHTAASGLAAPGRPLTAHTPVHTASVGKLMTAAVILRLVERGTFGSRGLDTTLADTEAFPNDVLVQLHAIHGRSHAPRITLRHLLTHTAGLRDGMVDDAVTTADEAGGPAPGSLVAAWVAEVLRDDHDGRGAVATMPGGWDPSAPDRAVAGALNWYLANGVGLHALAPPGERFHYSDTGFCILAVVAERIGGLPFHELQRRLVFEPIGLRRSWQHGVDDTPTEAGEPAADIWVGRRPVMASGTDVRFDWGGGGLVATVADLARFLRALLAGELFDRHATLAALTDWRRPPGLDQRRDAVGLGVQRWRMPWPEGAVGHAGSWGTRVFTDPRTGAVVAGSVNCSDRGDWLAELLDAAQEVLR